MEALPILVSILFYRITFNSHNLRKNIEPSFCATTALFNADPKGRRSRIKTLSYA